MKKRLLKIITVSSLIGLGLGCGGGLGLPTQPSDSENTENTENTNNNPPKYGKVWVEDYHAGQSIKMDLDELPDSNGNYHYDVLVGFNGYDSQTKKASISTKSIHEKYDHGIKRSE
ncbi:MAG: hypothetical protein Q7S33_01845 [Nanoarchaeota archaeon]|nr:hypothetical protein [Nanoarchaeota archaeon]